MKSASNVKQPSSIVRKVSFITLKIVGLFIILFFLVIGIFRFAPIPYSAFMLEYGIDQYQQRNDWPEIKHQWTPLQGISPNMQLAVIASEDQQFAHHNGFDFAAIEKVIREHLDNAAQIRGASTITQQVAKNLFLSPSRSFIRKGIEALLTSAIELCWPKHRILEVYLNIAEFGPGVFGVESAAQYYFHISASQLDEPHAALLAATLPSPKKYQPDRPSTFLQQRKRWIVRQMRNLGYAYLKKL